MPKNHCKVLTFSLKLPSIMDHKLPTLTSKPTSQIIIGKLEVLR